MRAGKAVLRCWQRGRVQAWLYKHSVTAGVLRYIVVCVQAKQYCFVGSAGAYEHDPVEPMHLERDPRKSSAGHKQARAACLPVSTSCVFVCTSGCSL